MRPKSVTVVCWFLIITGGLSILASYMTMNNPEARELMAKSPIPINIQFIIMCLGLFISLTCGVAMLKGKNWARLLYVGWSVIGFIIGVVTSPIKVAVIPGIILFLIFTFFLFRPDANNFFKPTEVVT